MTQWAHKNLDEIRDAVHNEILATLPTNYAMVDLNCLSQRMQLLKSEPEKYLASCREAMCLLCRQYKLYKCDVDVGWSENCAFVRHHVS